MNNEYRTDASCSRTYTHLLTGSEREQIESFLHDSRAEIVGLLQQLVAGGRTPGPGAWSGRAWVGAAPTDI